MKNPLRICCIYKAFFILLLSSCSITSFAQLFQKPEEQQGDGFRPGDIAIIGMDITNSFNATSNSIRFVNLVALRSGAVLKFTDRGWTNSNAFNTTKDEGTVSWEISSNVPAGSVFLLRFLGSETRALLTNVTEGTDLTEDLYFPNETDWSTVSDGLGTRGDNVFIFQSSNSNPYFLYGINSTADDVDFNFDGWCVSVSDTYTNGSRLPDGNGSINALTNGVNAMSFQPQKDMLNYTGPVTRATKSTWLQRIVTKSNWYGTNSNPESSIANTIGTKIDIGAPNTAPSIFLDEFAPSYVENYEPTIISANASAADEESNWTGGSLQVEITGNAGDADSLGISNTNGLFLEGTALFDGNTQFGTLSQSSTTGNTFLSVTFNANATNQRIQNLVRAINFTNTSDNPGDAQRTITFTLKDADGASNFSEINLSVIGLNDAPVIQTAEGQTISSKGKDEAVPVTVDKDISLSDVDNTTLLSATIHITDGYQSEEDRLEFLNDGSTMGNISGSFDLQTGLLALASIDGSATTAQWLSALKSVMYLDKSSKPVIGIRIIEFEIYDGKDFSKTSYKLVSVTSANADIATFKISEGELTPEFDPSVTEYKVTVDNSTTLFAVTPTTAADGTSIAINGEPAHNDTQSEPIELNIGDNTITIVITAPDGVTSKTYTVIVNRPASTLPVTLSGIRAFERTSSVEVTWKVSTQFNIEKYDVERSTNSIDFSKAGEVIAQANTASVIDYTWSDHQPNEGDNYYRIKIIDKDGSAIYSPVVKVNVKSSVQIKIWPNPVVHRTFNLGLGNSSGVKFVLSLFNVNGQRVYYSTIVSGGLSTTKKILLPAGLSNGVYRLQVRNDKQQFNKSILLQ